MKVLSIIPARGGSKAIPLKNLVRINRRPLLYYTVTASLRSKFVTRTIVSTDHPKIARVARSLGAEVVKRPKEIAGDTSPVELALEHVVNHLKETENYIPDIVMLLQNTSPLRNSKHIDEALKLMKRENYDSIISGFSTHIFIWKKSKKWIKPVNYNPLRRPNRQKLPEQFFENGAIFATKYKNFIKSHCRISGKIGFYRMPLEFSYNIDTLEDLNSLKKFFAA